MTRDELRLFTALHLQRCKDLRIAAELALEQGDPATTGLIALIALEQSAETLMITSAILDAIDQRLDLVVNCSPGASVQE